MLKKILRGHRAWTTAEPRAWDILDIMRKTEDKTTFVACTRKGAASINKLAQQVLFEDRKKKVIGCIPGDWEANEANYNEKGKVHPRVKLQPTMITIYKGLRIFLTRNLAKKDDFVNGMTAEVVNYDADSKCLEVETRTGKVLAVHLYTEDVEGHGRVTSFPIRLGYAGTVQKVQGATLEHVTFWPDAAGCRAAAYVALSRVKYDKDYLVGGKICPRHFVPAM